MNRRKFFKVMATFFSIPVLNKLPKPAWIMYEDATIWIDTINGQSGVVSCENGTAKNPVDTLDDATTLAANLGFTEFMIAPGSALTLTQGYDGFTFKGVDWALALGGQSISGATLIGATVIGVCTGANAPSFLNCIIGSVTVPTSRFTNCVLTGSIACAAVGSHTFNHCYSNDEFIDGVPDKPVHTWLEALALSQKMNL